MEREALKPHGGMNGGHEYRVAIMYAQPTLAEPEQEAFAVIVAGLKSIMITGTYPDAMDKMSEVGRHLLDEFPAVLKDRLDKIVEEKLDVFEDFSSAFPWNIHLGPTEHVASEENILILARDLFRERVLQPQEDAAQQRSTSGFFADVSYV